MARNYRVEWTTSDGRTCRSVIYTEAEARHWCQLGNATDPHLRHRVVNVSVSRKERSRVDRMKQRKHRAKLLKAKGRK
jgi:hypothetical protein